MALKTEEMVLNMGHLLSIPFVLAGLILMYRPINMLRKKKTAG